MSAEPKPPAKRRRLRVRWRRVLLAFALLILAIEVSLRIFFGFGHPLLYQTDPDCGYLPKPSQDIVRLRSHNFVNSHSMRSPEFAMPKPADRYRVLCVGDSVTYGTTFVPQDQIFTSQLAAKLSAAQSRQVEVLNESTGGWAPENEVKALTSRGTYGADLVLMIWNTADLDQAFAPFPGGPSFPTENPWTALGEVWSRYAVPRLFHQAPQADPGSLAGTGSAEGMRIATDNLNLLGQSQAFANKNGAAFAIVLIPSGPSYQTAARITMRSQLTSWTQDHHVPFLDLTDAFSHDSPEALTIDGIHLRPHGHDVVAKELLARWPELQPTSLATATATASSPK